MACSSETWVALGVPRASVGLDVGLLDTRAGAEVPLGLAHGRASEQKRATTFYNYKIDRLESSERARKKSDEAGR